MVRDFGTPDTKSDVLERGAQRRSGQSGSVALKGRAGPTDTYGAVNPRTWTFGRENQRLEVSQCETTDGWLLVLTRDDGTPHSYEFSSTFALTRFQCDMEAFLLKTGWGFLEFSPERRQGRDRRTFPRIDERRRWWTDGTVDMNKVVWG